MKVSIIAICLCIFYFTASSASPSPQRNDDPCFCQLTNSVICKRRRKEHGCISATTESAFALTGGTTESAIVSSRPPSGGADVVNCEWSTWSSSGTCSESCGGGNQIYVRSHRVKSKNGGQDCDGLFHKTERCNTNSCPFGPTKFLPSILSIPSITGVPSIPTPSPPTNFGPTKFGPTNFVPSIPGIDNFSDLNCNERGSCSGSFKTVQTWTNGDLTSRQTWTNGDLTSSWSRGDGTGSAPLAYDTFKKK